MWSMQRDGPVVPLTQIIVKNNSDGSFIIIRDLASSLVDFIDDVDHNFEPSASSCSFQQGLHQSMTGKNDALHGPRQMRKNAMFNRIPLGAVRGIMRHSDFDGYILGQFFEFGLENKMTGRIAAAPICQN